MQQSRDAQIKQEIHNYPWEDQEPVEVTRKRNGNAPEGRAFEL